MKYICQISDIVLDCESVVVLGNFDGVHKGHQKLLRTATQKANQENRVAVALSFYPHPTWVLGNQPKPLIMSRLDRKRKIEEMNIDIFIEYPFTKEFASITPEVFFEDILINKLKATTVIVGQNYYFGKKKQGDVARLKELGKKYKVEIIAIDTVIQKQQVISSTQIRKLIEYGKMEEATEELGHPYSITGRVVHGKKLGRTRGFPTANLIADPDRIYPPNGVYASRIKMNTTYYWGVTNVGYNPTVSSDVKMIETNIFDFDQMIYGEEIEVQLLRFIRQEKKFDNLEALYTQINKDTQDIKNFSKQMINSLQA